MEKSKTMNKELNMNKEFEFIKPHVADDVKPDDLYLFTLRVCDTRIDRDKEKMTRRFLDELAEYINKNTLPLIKDHQMTVDGIVGCIYRAEVITDDTELDELGEPVAYVLGYAYCPNTANSVGFIRANLYEKVSVSYTALSHTCSVCGEDVGGNAMEHLSEHLQEASEGQLLYTITDDFEDAIEVSFVVAPCQERAAVVKKSREGGVTDMSQVKSAPVKKEADLTIDELRARNTELEARIAELEAELDAYKMGGIKSAVSKAIDGLRPVSAKIKAKMMNDVDFKKLSMKADGTVEGLDVVIEYLVEEWAGAFEPEELADKVEEVAEEVLSEDVDKTEVEIEEEEEVKEAPIVLPADVDGVPIAHTKSRNMQSTVTSKARLARLFNV